MFRILSSPAFAASALNADFYADGDFEAESMKPSGMNNAKHIHIYQMFAI